MSILLTGAAGFIGSAVARLLIDKGYRVFAVDNLNDYYDVRLKRHRLEQLQGQDNFRFQQLDIENAEALRACFEQNQFEAVLNLAARAGVRYSMENPQVYYTTNVLGSLNLLELVREFRVPKYVLASTSSLYAGLPMPFGEDLPVNEPISPYAASKKAAEVMAYTYHHLYGIDVSTVRYFTVYGPAGRPDMSIFRFIRWIDEGVPLQLFGDGTRSRDFTYVTEIAEGTVAALRSVGCETINLGGGQQPVSMNEIIRRLETLLGKQARISEQPAHIAELKETWADISKANRLLNWSPQVSLEEGLAKSVDWYLQNRELAMSIEL